MKRLNGIFFGAAVLFFVLAGASRASEETALDRYIAQPDSHYEYHLIRKERGDGYTANLLEMTSQQWLTTNEVNKPIWKHWVTIIVPNDASGDTGLLFITGGSNERPAPEKPDQNMAKIALLSKSVVTELRMVPSEPLVFTDEQKSRTEDGIIAYTWDKFLRTGDEKWPARLPMTKSAVRAMDTVTDFCGKPENGGQHIGKFVVAGASKRGWTTWTTAAVDKRVVAIVPIVIDMLNVVPSFKHHYAAYGFWAPAVHDYEAMGIMEWQDTPQYAALMKIEEPYQYRGRLTMPKLLINAAGDQFFLPDSSQFYWKDLLGPKYIRYVPNADHSLKNTDAVASLLSFYDAVIHGKQIPQYEWTLPEPGVIRVVCKTKPARAKLCQANNPNARDFRLESIGPAYKSSPVAPNDEGVYEARVEKPEKGWTAAFIELTWDNQPAPFKFTSGVTVIPETLPFEGKFVPKPPKSTASK
jgi:PhoPQ-activated pathogenicity-related protein